MKISHLVIRSAGVQTRVLVKPGKRNADRFPGDFMFQRDAEEWKILRSQSVISSVKHKGTFQHPVKPRAGQA